MSVAVDINRRRGGREARVAMRSRAIPVHEAAVRPGMTGGRYKPLSEGDLEKIHAAALTLLEKVGIGNSIPSCIELMTEKGCTLGGDGRLRFPRALIEDTLTICARRFPLFARDPKYDL